MTSLNVFYWQENFVFCFEFHFNLFLDAQLIVIENVYIRRFQNIDVKLISEKSDPIIFIDESTEVLKDTTM